MDSGRTKVAAAACAVLLATVSTGAIAQPQTTFIFNQPAESLSQALRDVAVRTGRNVIAPDTLIGARQAPSLSGSYTAEGAVTRLLSGSGLQLTFSGNDLIVATTSYDTAKAVGASNNPTTITITGTRIRGAGSASQVVVATRKDLEQAGVNDLADFTRILPQNYTGGQNRGIAGGGEQGGQSNVNNSAALNLRGLGPDATLTLLNGHRLSYDAADQGVDISAIPLNAIERIEVVPDGASALYGSDAVAGVANIILRHHYEGIDTTARVGGTSDGGDLQQEYSLVGGHRWSSGGFMIALDRESSTPVYAGQRQYARSVDPTLTLITQNHQVSGVISGHQQLTPGLYFELDGYAMNRRTEKQNPFLPTESVFVDGLVTRPHVRSFGATSTLRADIDRWQIALSATDAGSRTAFDSINFSKGIPRVRKLLYADKLRGVEITGEGPLIALPGGDARLAVGGGLRRISLHGRIASFKNGQSFTVSDYTPHRVVQFAYGEISLPVVAPETKVLLVDRLTFSGALRYEHWNSIATVTTPKIGIIYQPGPSVTFRATWGKSFKIPTLYQVHQVLQGALLPPFYFSPPPQPAGSTVLYLGGSNPDLKPERATTWSVAVELKPKFIPGLEIQASNFHVDYRDRIASPISSSLTVLYNPLYSEFITYNPSVAQVNAAIATLPQGLINQTGAAFDPSNVGAIEDVAIRNTAREQIDGVDVNADYRLAFGPRDQLLLTGAASYLKSREQIARGLPFINVAGTVFNPPHWRGRAGAVWDNQVAGLSAFVNYVGATRDGRFPVVKTIAPFVTLDLTASLRTGDMTGPLRDFEVRVSALNVLNQKPHFIRNAEPQGAPYDSTNESPVGRFFGVSIQKVW